MPSRTTAKKSLKKPARRLKPRTSERTIAAVAILAQLLFLIAPAIPTASADASMPTISTDKDNYTLFQTVHITGTNFAPLVGVILNITGGTEGQADYTSTTNAVGVDENGTFTYDYTIDDIVRPTYTVTASDIDGNQIAQMTFEDNIGYNKGVYRTDQGKWSTGNAGAGYQENQWAYYQYQITGITGGTVPSFNVTFNHFQNGAPNAIFVDAFSNFRACLDDCGGTVPGGMLPDGTAFPPTSTTNWKQFTPTNINNTYTSGSCSGTDALNTPSADHCFHVNGPTLGSTVSVPVTGTHSITLFFEAHLAATFVWATSHENQLNNSASIYYVNPGPEAIPANTAYGTGIYSTWTNPFNGIGSATGSSRQFQLQDQSDGPNGAISLPIPAVTAPTGSITITKVTNPTPAAGVTFPFTSDFGPFTLDTDPSATNPNTKTFTQLPAASFNFTETQPPASGWALTNLACVTNSGTAGSTFSTSTSTGLATVNLASGAVVTCTYTNTLQQPKLTLVKTVTNNNGGAAAITSWTLAASGPTPISGTSGSGSVTNASVTAGSYTLSESGGPAGYTPSTYSCVKNGGAAVVSNSITLVAGDNATCTINNNDNAPSLTLLKTVTNDNGGTAVNTAWTLTATGTGGSPTNLSGSTPVASGATFKADTYTLGETGGPTGYAASTYSCVKNGGGAVVNNTITLALGDTATCTINNNDIQPKLTVTKVVINDNGGTKVISDFPLFVGATGVTSGVQNGFNVGTYTVSETGQAGYAAAISGDCAANGSITLALGDVKSCTITNNDQAGTLIVKKVLINDNGGNAAVTDFSFKVNGGSTIAFEGDAQNDITVNAGTYSVVENPAAGYSTTYNNCTSVVVPNGGSATCTITNNDIAPTITLNKVVINDNGGTAGVNDFGLTVGGTPVTSGLTVNVSANTPIAINEAGLTGYAFVSITGNAKCPAVLGGTATLDEGENITCTITNNDIQPKLTVTKVVINDNGGTKVISDFPLFVNATGVTSGVQNGFNANTYTVSETNQAGYTGAITGDCAANGSITLHVGDVKSCTITNNDVQPKLTVTKVVVNNNGGTKVVADFPLFVGATGVTSGVQNGFNAAAYVVSETGQTGYVGTITGDCDAQGNITLQAGDVKSCTITNNDIQPKLTVTKVVVNDNGGTKVVADFPLFVDATSVTSGIQNGFNAATYTVSETNQPGYAAAITGDCASNGSITLHVGDVKACTITNNDIAPQLTVIKHVINDNGGTAVASNFTMQVTGTNVSSSSFPGNEAGTAVTLDQGSYSVDEAAFTGYAKSFSGDCSGTISVGETKTCTITNNDIRPTLTLHKTVVTDNGGNEAVSDFPLFVSGVPTTSGTVNFLTAGIQYTASETTFAGYLPSVWTGDCAENGTVTLAVGQNANCYITNDDVAPTLTVVKTVINNDGGTKQVADFPLFVNGSPVTSGSVNTLSANVLYTATETTLPGYTPSVWGGDCAADGTITLNEGDAKTCTITNDDQPAHLVVIKHVINDNGGTALAEHFTLDAGGSNDTPDNFPGAENPGTTVTLDAGSYSVSETGPAGYAASYSADCAGTLANGETKTCTVTNDDIAPSLHLRKLVTNDNGGTAQDTDWTLSAAGATPINGSTPVDSDATLSAGTYDLSETGPTGYSASAWLCEGGLQDGSQITLALGESATCTITNDDIAPQLTVIKHVINDNGGTAAAGNFTMNVTGTNVSNPNFAGDELGTTVTLDQGAYSVDEAAFTGYAKSFAGDCVGSIAVGETKTCTITNNDIQPKLTLTKVVTNDNGGNAVVADFPLFVDATPVTSGAQNGFDAATYVASETNQPGYTAGLWTGDCAANGSITLHVGDVKACTITNNDDAPHITLTKVVTNDHGGTAGADDFGISIGGAPVTSGVTYQVDANTSYALNEAGLAGYAFVSLTGDAKCPQVLGGTVTLDEGESVSCTITNNDIAPQLVVIKHVINDNGGTAVAGNFTLDANGTDDSPDNFPGAETPGTTVTLDAGAYNVTETGPAGYAASFSEDCTGSIAIGETKTCTVTNDDIQPKLTVTKVVINDNGGNAEVIDFPLFVDATGVTSGVQNGFNAASYIVSETGQPGYAPVITGDCDANGNITLNIGDVKACTITNDDVAPTVTLIKDVINDNGGTAGVNDFGLTIGGTAVNSGDTLPVDANTAIALSEAGRSDYTFTGITGDPLCPSVLGGTVTLDEGQNITCTIHNDDIQPLLTVIKHVINNDGGNNAAGDFTMNVTATNVSNLSFPGDEAGTTVTLDAGSYNADETAFPGYSKILGPDCSGIIAVGEHKTCTITNDDQPASITLNKVVINNHGGTAGVNDFGISIGGTTVNSGTTLPVNSNAAIAISEDGLTGYTFVSLTGDAKCPTVLGGSTTLNEGENITCTITNDDIAPQLIVIKHVINDNGGTATAANFTLDANGTDDTPDNFPGAEAPGTTVTLDAGAFNVTETGPTGYAASFSADCTGSITIGETKTCTVTNDDIQPKLTVTKVVVNDNGGNKQVSDFPLFVSGNGVTSGVQTGFNAGSYAVTETGQTGYAASPWSGDCAANGAITLNVGDVKACTITNDDIQPTLTLIKHVTNNNGGSASISDFPLHISDGVTTINTTSGTVNFLTANVAYTASETTFAGYLASSWTGNCALDGTITLQPGDNATCEITNDDQVAHLTVIKRVINDNGGTATAGNFSMQVSGTNVSDGLFPGDESGTTVTLDAGSFGVTETGPTGYAASFSADCSGTIANGASKTCTVTNNDVAPSLTLVKTVINNNGGLAVAANWTLTATGPTPISGAGGTASNGSFSAGTYTLTESAGPSGYAASAWVCQGGTQNGSQITLAVGETATCTITNDDIPATISGMKFNDLNHNGIKDSGEPGLSGWTINLDLGANGTVDASTLTNGSGNYSFTNLNPGTYRIREVQQAGWVQTTPNPADLTVVNGQNVINVNFGNFLPPPTTRTQGFWQTHTAFTSSVFATFFPAGMTVGTGGHTRLITNVQSAGQSKLFGAYYSSIPKKTVGGNRTSIDKARMQLLQQLVTIKLNCAAFGCSGATLTMITSADAAYANGPESTILSFVSQLDAYNNSGDNQPIPGSLGNPGSATPATSQSWANLAFWDAP